MSPLLARSGLFIAGVAGLYIVFGLPLTLAIAAIAGMIGGRGGPGLGGLRWSNLAFARTFRLLLLLGLGLVLATCVGASLTIPPR